MRPLPTMLKFLFLGSLLWAALLSLSPKAFAKDFSKDDIERWIDTNLTADNPQFDPLLAAFNKALKSDKIRSMAPPREVIYAWLADEKNPLILRRLLFVALIKRALMTELTFSSSGALNPPESQLLVLRKPDPREQWPESILRRSYDPETFANTLRILGLILENTGEIDPHSAADLSLKFSLLPASQVKTIRRSALFQFDEAFEQLSLTSPELAKHIALILNRKDTQSFRNSHAVHQHLTTLVLIFGNLDRKAETPTDSSFLTALVLQMSGFWQNHFLWLRQANQALPDPENRQPFLRKLWREELPDYPYPADPGDCSHLL